MPVRASERNRGVARLPLALRTRGARLADSLAQALARRVVVASIGPSCSHQLRSLGIHPRVVPPIPKMRPLVSSLSDYFSFVRA
jgi:uroporphyrinogen-III synthase